MRELVERATPGPWKDGNGIEDKHGNKIASIVYCGYEDPRAIANAQLIARLSPSVVLAILYKIELARDTLRSASTLRQCELAIKELNAALALLDGKNTEI